MNRPPRTGNSLRTTVLAVVATAWLGADRSMADVTPTSGSGITVLSDQLFATNDVAMPAWLTETGWNIKEMILTYNTKTDTLDVDIKTTGVAGMAVGNLNPSQEAMLKAAGGLDLPNFGGDKSITVAFAAAGANGKMGATIALAGVPSVKTSAGGLDGFELAHYVPGKGGLENSYGTPITNGPTGTLLYNPSLAQPDFEFTISNFSKLTGLNPTDGFFFSAYAGSAEDVSVGEKHTAWSFVGGFIPAGQTTPTPEPASFVLLGLGGAGFWLAGRRVRSRRTTAS
jgi:hypothetical protein